MNFRIASCALYIGRQASFFVSQDCFRRNNIFPLNVATVVLQSSCRSEFSTKPPTQSKGVLVYEGPKGKQIRRVKIFSLMTSIMGICAQPMVLTRTAELGSSTSTTVVVCSVVGFFTFVTPLLLHYITKKYVISILHYPSEDSYVASTYSLFLRRKNLHMKPGDGMLSDVPGMFTTISVRGNPLFIDPKFFSDVHHYKKIMGFDRPIDFKLKSNMDSS